MFQVEKDYLISKVLPIFTYAYTSKNNLLKKDYIIRSTKQINQSKITGNLKQMIKLKKKH